MGNNGKKFAIGAGLAAAAGYVAGILTAPKSGKETRKELKDTAEKGVAKTEEQLSKAEEALDSAKTTFAQSSDKVKDSSK